MTAPDRMSGNAWKLESMREHCSCNFQCTHYLSWMQNLDTSCPLTAVFMPSSGHYHMREKQNFITDNQVAFISQKSWNAFHRFSCLEVDLLV